MATGNATIPLDLRSHTSASAGAVSSIVKALTVSAIAASVLPVADIYAWCCPPLSGTVPSPLPSQVTRCLALLP